MTILHDPGLKLHELMDLPPETEWVEFKEAKNDFGFDEKTSVGGELNGNCIASIKMA